MSSACGLRPILAGRPCDQALSAGSLHSNANSLSCGPAMSAGSITQTQLFMLVCIFFIHASSVWNLQTQKIAQMAGKA